MMNTAHSTEAAGAQAAPIACWSCRGAVAAGMPFCATCRAVQPPGGADHFARLGLARGYDVDIAELDRRYFALQRQLHPDRFVAKTGRERAIAQSQAASLNDAYETLRDPLSRAVYLLRLDGILVEREDGATISDPELLMEAMEMREALAEAGDAAAVGAVAERMEHERRATLERIATAFRAGDKDAAHKATLRLKYLVRLDDDIRGRRAAMRVQAAKAQSERSGS